MVEVKEQIRVKAANPAEVVDGLERARSLTLELISSLSDEQLECVHSTLMSPLAWDLGHIAAFEDLWLRNRLAGKPLLREGLAEIYDAFETPRAKRGDLDFLSAEECRAYLAEVRGEVLDHLSAYGVEDPFLYEMVIQHEHQHNETMLQTLELASLETFTPPNKQDLPQTESDLSGLELVKIPAGPFEMGTSSDSFAYDNERPQHEVKLADFEIGITAVTNGTFAKFIESSGYSRQEWWSPEGWQWLHENQVTLPRNWIDLENESSIEGVRKIDPRQPVAHISWYEADAFARSHGLRLPTEAEWEKAASGSRPEEANLGQRSYQTAQVGAYPQAASTYGCLGMLGDLWEWTASEFAGHPGFKAYPYPEYSQVFFNSGYRVLKGGSWATHERVATITFRNWDFPQRRQIFSGLRVCQ